MTPAPFTPEQEQRIMEIAMQAIAEASARDAGQEARPIFPTRTPEEEALLQASIDRVLGMLPGVARLASYQRRVKVLKNEEPAA